MRRGPCIHLTTYEWTLDLTRHCEIGKFDDDLQRAPAMVKVGDVMARIPNIHPDRLDTSPPSATIRALGRAASSNACVAKFAQRDLETLLRAQAHAMVTQE